MTDRGRYPSWFISFWPRLGRWPPILTWPTPQ